MNVRRHRRSNIQIQQEARAWKRLQHLAQNRPAMRPRLLQDLRRRDRRLRDLRLRGLHHLTKALQVSHQARSLPTLPNLKLEEMKDSEDDFFTDLLLPPSFKVRYIKLTPSGSLDYKLYNIIYIL